MWFYKKRRGFTLLELMIVVLIVGILASLGLPRFIKAIRKAKEAEAKHILGAIRSAQLRYYAEHNTYTTDISDLDVGPITGGTGDYDSDYYTYTAINVGGNIGDAEAKVSGISNFRVNVDGEITTY